MASRQRRRHRFLFWLPVDSPPLPRPPPTQYPSPSPSTGRVPQSPRTSPVPQPPVPPPAPSPPRGSPPAPQPSSLSPPAPSQPESMQPAPEHITSQPTSQPEPKPQESQPLAEGEAKPSSPRVLKPKALPQIASQAEAPDQTQITKDSHPSEEETRPSQDIEPKTTPAPSTERITPAQQPKSTIEETKEQKPHTSPEATQFIQPSRLPQEEKPTDISEEKPEPEPLEMQPVTPTQKPESKTVIPRITSDEPKTKPETQQTEKTLPSVTEEPVKRLERSDSGPTRSEADTGEVVTEIRIPRPRTSEKPVGTARNGLESNIAISSIPPAGERGSFETELKEGITKLVQKLNIGQPKQPGNGNAVTMITLAGENKGACMVIGYDTTDSEGLTYIQRDRKLDKDKIDTIKRYDGSHIERQAHTDTGKEAIIRSINSNVQSINNSLLHESSCNERDPGVHLTMSTRPIEPLKSMEKPEACEKFKAAFSTTPAQKLTYEPNIRRRCLRGLFLESSEDDPENPQKPRRHGCRFSCDDKKKGKVDPNGTSTTNNAKHTEEGTSRA